MFLLGESSHPPPWDGLSIFPPDQAACADSLLLFNIASLSLLRSSITQLSSSPQLDEPIKRCCLTLSRIIDDLRRALDRLPDAAAIAAVANMLAPAAAAEDEEPCQRSAATELHATGTSSQATTLRICYLLHFLSSVAQAVMSDGRCGSIGAEMQRVLASVTWCCQLSSIAVAIAFCPPPAIINPSLHALAMSLITDFASQTATNMVTWSLTNTPPSAAPFPLWAPLWSLPPLSKASPLSPLPATFTAPSSSLSSKSSSSSSSSSAAAAAAAAAAAGFKISPPQPPLRCPVPTSGAAVGAAAVHLQSAASAACAYSDYYLAALAANVCECIAAVARSNKALLQQTHMRALTEGVTAL